MNRPIPDRQNNTFKQARLCVFANESSTVFVSAAITAEIIARIEGDFPAIFAPDLPVFWLPEQDMTAVLGKASWDAAIQRLSYELVAIPRAEWGEARLLATLRRVFPTIEPQTLDAVESGE